jgi:hypothetical protein
MKPEAGGLPAEAMVFILNLTSFLMMQILSACRKDCFNDLIPLKVVRKNQALNEQSHLRPASWDYLSLRNISYLDSSICQADKQRAYLVF